MEIVMPRGADGSQAASAGRGAVISPGAGMIDERSALALAHREILLRLARAAAYKDADTAVHIDRIGYLASHLAREAGLSREFCERLCLAAPMHDIGKIGIPEAILRKPGPLDAAEWSVMRQHPAIGESLLRGSGIPLLDLAAEIAGAHHERFDGSGYPGGLRGVQIPLSARIVALVDTLDALAMDRCYRPGWAPERIRRAVTDAAGAHFDPELVAILVARFDDYLEIRRVIDEACEPPPA